ncbi:MAG: hypothetical protein FWD84_01495 [Oscillospiraceae bacterium]|nr:hypothetical protein [Oscillospiraceae bacterium]
MNRFTPQEIEHAERAIASLLHKCERAEEKLTAGTSQHTLMKNRIAALRIALTLIREQLL